MLWSCSLDKQIAKKRIDRYPRANLFPNWSEALILYKEESWKENCTAPPSTWSAKHKKLQSKLTTKRTSTGIGHLHDDVIWLQLIILFVKSLSCVTRICIAAKCILVVLIKWRHRAKSCPWIGWEPDLYDGVFFGEDLWNDMHGKKSALQHAFGRRKEMKHGFGNQMLKLSFAWIFRWGVTLLCDKWRARSCRFIH